MSTGQTGTAVTVQARKATEVRETLAKMQDQLAAALPKHLTAERMIRVAVTAVQKNRDLGECSTRSIIGCIVEASQLGLEPDGILGLAYLVPFRNRQTGQKEAQLIPGYRGLVDLCRRSGQLSQICARCVYAKDKHRVVYGLHPKLEHTPADSDDPGPMIAAYAVANLRDGGTQFEWMWRKEIDAIRARSRAGSSGPWVTDYEAMAKKTVLRRLCKLLPVSVEVQRLVAQDEARDACIDVTPLAVDMAPGIEPPLTGLDALLPPEPEAAPEETPPNTQQEGEDLFSGQQPAEEGPGPDAQYHDGLASADTMQQTAGILAQARQQAQLGTLTGQELVGIEAAAKRRAKEIVK